MNNYLYIRYDVKHQTVEVYNTDWQRVQYFSAADHEKLDDEMQDIIINGFSLRTYYGDNLELVVYSKRKSVIEWYIKAHRMALARKNWTYSKNY